MTPRSGIVLILIPDITHWKPGQEENMFEFHEVDLRIPDPARKAEGKRTTEAVFRLNQACPGSAEYQSLLEDLFAGQIGASTRIVGPLYVNLAKNIHIGDYVSIQPYLRCMSAGNIEIEDHVMIAMNVSLVTNNHDPYQRDILTVADIRIKKGAWIGTGAIILPGVTVGKHAIVGAGSVVNRDIPDYAVAVGNPARVIRYLDPDKFAED